MEANHQVTIFLSEAGKSFSISRSATPYNIMNNIMVVLEESRAYNIFSEDSIITVFHLIPGNPVMTSIKHKVLNDILKDNEKILDNIIFRKNLVPLFEFYPDAECVYVFNNYREFLKSTEIDNCGISFDIFKNNSDTLFIGVCNNECVRKITEVKLKGNFVLENSIRFSKQDIAKYVKGISEITGEGKYF